LGPICPEKQLIMGQNKTYLEKGSRKH